MRNFAVTILLAFSTQIYAGDYYYSASVDVYDPITGFYYKSIEDKSGDGGMLSKSSTRHNININIYDPESGKSALLFKEGGDRDIVATLFETGFKDGAVLFNGSLADIHIKNNEGISKRTLKDQLLVAVLDSKTKVTTLLVSTKRGESLRTLASVPADATWHIDVKNSKIRVVRRAGERLQIESLNW